MTKYFIEVKKVIKDFYTGKERFDWKRRKEVFNTKEEALETARRCRNAWVIVKAEFDEKTFKVKEKIVADNLHN